MKKVLLGLIATVMFGAVGNAQENNPYNKVGLDAVTAAVQIAKDLRDHKLVDITQATLDNYKKTLPGFPVIKLSDFSTIFRKMTTMTNSELIKNSGGSAEAQDFLRQSCCNGSISGLVDKVKISKLIDSEKQTVLTVLAMNYNLMFPTQRNTIKVVMPKGPNANFETYTEENFDFKIDGKGTNATWFGTAGAAIGSIFGPVGALIGGLVGLTIGVIGDVAGWDLSIGGNHLPAVNNPFLGGGNPNQGNTFPTSGGSGGGCGSGGGYNPIP